MKHAFVLRKTGLRWGLAAVLLFCSQAVYSAGYVPLSFSGAISYSFGYSKAQAGGESESHAVSLSFGGGGFIWQPWFITAAGGLTFGFIRNSTSNSQGSTSYTGSGTLQFNVFPSSRFPFSLVLDHSDSQVENLSALQQVPRTRYTSSRFLILQTYKARSGFITNASWSRTRFDTQDVISESDIVNADARNSHHNSSWALNGSYSTSRSSNSDREPQNYHARFRHNYLPGNSLGVNSNASLIHIRENSSDVNLRSSFVQANSVAVWRPVHKPYNFSTGARISTSQSDSGVSESESNSMSVNMGVNYRASRKIAIGMNGFVTATENTITTLDPDTNTPETESSQTNAAGASASTGYSSDQYGFSGFRWHWNTGLSISSSYVSINDDTNTLSQGGANLSHSLAREWSAGRTSTISSSFNQSISGSIDSRSNDSRSLGTGLSAGWSGSGAGGSTYVGGSISDSRSDSSSNPVNKGNSQFASVQFSRNQNINRVSSATGNIAFLASQQERAGNPRSVTSNGTANINYRNLRFAGIYAMQYRSVISYNRVFRGVGASNSQIVRWENRWTYAIGLLDTSMDLDFIRQNSRVRGTLRFRATRSF